MKVRQYPGRGGVTLAADVGGDPAQPSVVLMHGGGQTRYSWGRAARELVRMGYHVVSLDLRGHGESDWAPDGDYSMDAFVGDVLAVIATLAQPPALVGASLGGITALLAIGESLTPVARALVLVDVVPRIEPSGAEAIVNFMRGNPGGFPNLEEAADAVARYLPHRPRPRNAEGLKKNLRVGEDGRLYWHWDPGFIAGIERFDNTAFSERLDSAAKSITLPTLLVRGKQSEVVSAEGARSLLELIPHAEYVDVEGAGHMVAGDKNDTFNAAVEDFLGRTLPAAVV